MIFAGCCRWRQWSWVGRGLSSRRPSRRLFGLSARRAYIQHARRATRRRAASGAVGRRSDERFRSRPTRSAVLPPSLAIGHPPEQLNRLFGLGAWVIWLGGGFRGLSEGVMPLSMIDTQAIRRRWNDVGSKLDERRRRLFAAGRFARPGGEGWRPSRRSPDTRARHWGVA